MKVKVTALDLVVKRGLTLAVDRAIFTIPDGSWFGIVGSNGSGKTSLLRAIGGRLPIAGGTCIIDGRDVTADRQARARTCGFNPPNSSLPDGLKLRELLSLAAGDLEQACASIGVLWEPLGLGTLTDHWIGQMSSGMRQRVSIGLAFARSCDLVLLDEPFNWLDPVAAHDLKLALRSKVEEGITLCTALHDLTTMCLICDAGAMMLQRNPIIELSEGELSAGRRDPIDFEGRMIARFRGATGGGC